MIEGKKRQVSRSILRGGPVRVLQGCAGGGGVIGGDDLHILPLGLCVKRILVLPIHRHKAAPHVACQHAVADY